MRHAVNDARIVRISLERPTTVRPAILRAGCEPYNWGQDEADHCKNDETDVATREVIVIFDNAPPAPEPTVRALNYPALWAICRNPWRYLSAQRSRVVCRPAAALRRQSVCLGSPHRRWRF